MADTATNPRLLGCGHFRRQADGQLMWKGNDHVLTADRFQVGFVWWDTRRGKVVEVRKGEEARKLGFDVVVISDWVEQTKKKH